MINIKVNKTRHQFQRHSSLEFILNVLDISINGIAVAINQNIISKVDWSTTTLAEGDQIDIVTATQGG